MNPLIKETTANDRDKLLSIIKNSDQFDDESLEHVKQTLDEHLSNPVFPVLIDCRSFSVYRKGHIKGALFITR